MSSEKFEDSTCHSCNHFFITHEKEFPYGCRAIDFKSVRLPSIDVEEADGQRCLAHESKFVKSGEKSLMKGGAQRRSGQGNKINIEV